MNYSDYKKRLACHGSIIDVPIQTGMVPEYRAVYDQMLTKSTVLDKYAQNYMVRNLVRRNYWNRFDYLLFLACHINSGGEAYLNYKLPAGGSDCISYSHGFEFPDNITPGAGDGWESGYAHAFSIVTGNGFSGRAQRVEHVYGAGDTMFYYPTGITLTPNKYYRITGKFRAGAANWRLSLRLTDTIATTNIGTASTATSFNYVVKAGTPNEMVITWSKGNPLASDWIEFGEIKVVPWNNATGVNNPVHTAREGVIGDGLINYINTRFNPTAWNGNFKINSATQILYIRTNLAVTGGHGIFASADLKDFFIEPRRLTNLAYIRANDNGSNNGACSDSRGIYFNTRTASNVKKLYLKKVAIINGTIISTGRPTLDFFNLAYNDDNVAGGFRADQLAIIAYMDGCTQEDVNGLTDIFNNTMTLLGKNVF